MGYWSLFPLHVWFHSDARAPSSVEAIFKAVLFSKSRRKPSRKAQDSCMRHGFPAQTRSTAASNSTPPSSRCGTNCNKRTIEGSLPGTTATTATSKPSGPPKKENPQWRTHVSGGDNKVESTHYRGPETTGGKHGLAQTLIFIICTSIDYSLNYPIKTGRVVKLMSRLLASFALIMAATAVETSVATPFPPQISTDFTQ